MCLSIMKPVLRHSSFFFKHFWRFLHPSKAPLEKCKWKRVFAGFENGFTAFIVLVLPLWRFFCFNQRYRCLVTAKTCVLRLWDWFYGIRRSFFGTLEVFCVDQKYRWLNTCISLFAGFETWFTAFLVLFLAYCRFFCVHRSYRFQDSGLNVSSFTLKPVLQHSLFLFKHYRGYFASIEGTVAKIRMKTFVRLL